MYYYKIDLTDPEEDSNGFSCCVSCDSPLTDEEAIEASIAVGEFDRDTLSEYDVVVTDITKDDDELNHFKVIAEHFDNSSPN